MTTDEHELRTARSYKLILLFAMVMYDLVPHSSRVGSKRILNYQPLLF
jgi:hypothetical protein